ncbi:MAG: D-2-hydroxyacid dehydrogenase [Betaproteobacteria bacterium]|nr:D-2-hydroxyacid dehydrogenase [Betaproteobacteria bacterium]
MKKTVAIYENALDHIKGRVDADQLKIQWIPYTKEGMYLVDGKRLNPQDVRVDYLWLSPLVSVEKFLPEAFEMALQTASIKVLQTFNAGLDHPFYKKIAALGTMICNSSAQGVAIAEYVFAQVFYRFHPIALQRQQQADRLWRNTPFRELSQSTWLIIGFGPIGQAIARRAKAFGAKTLVVRRRPQTAEHVDHCASTSELLELLPQADIIVLACALNERTRQLANRQFYTRTKPDALLINVARGAVIDHQALLEALDQEKLGHAVLDVFDTEPLPPTDRYWSHPKVSLTSHTSFAGSGTMARWNDLFLANIERFAKGERLENLVDPASLLD